MTSWMSSVPLWFVFKQTVCCLSRLGVVMLYPTKLEATTPVLLLNSRHVGIQLSFYEKSLRQHPLRLSIHVLRMIPVATVRVPVVSWSAGSLLVEFLFWTIRLTFVGTPQHMSDQDRCGVTDVSHIQSWASILMPGVPTFHPCSNGHFICMRS